MTRKREVLAGEDISDLPPPSHRHPMSGEPIWDQHAVRAVLSKLRAPVADERAAFDAWFLAHPLNRSHHMDTTQIDDAFMPYQAWQARAALASAPVAKPNRAPVDDGIFWSSKEIQRRQREEDEARAAYYHSRASAPVAGQAQPDGYAYRYQYGDGTVVRFNNGGEVNGCRPIESIPYWLGPAPQASASVRIGRATTKGGRVQSYAFQQTDLPDGEHALIVGAPQPSPVAWEAVAWVSDTAGATDNPKLAETWRKMGWPVRPLVYGDAAPQASEAVAQPLIARALAEWHEDDGPVTWWAWCGHEWAGEAPWCGTPLDQDWPGYHTHWTPIPGVPAALSAQPGARK